ncbi:hypothetical protein CLF_107031 [Clonorchis sinensis]|uniref:Pol-related protein n=1 Tax=Clonorchis sinensis TaxID=79923 RepID=G7YQC2_CLOSI|nr:hypothetical protein CLF_107031 [Clonorchis sinensis]
MGGTSIEIPIFMKITGDLKIARCLRQRFSGCTVYTFKRTRESRMLLPRMSQPANDKERLVTNVNAALLDSKSTSCWCGPKMPDIFIEDKFSCSAILDGCRFVRRSGSFDHKRFITNRGDIISAFPRCKKSAQKAFAVLRMNRRTFSRITRTDSQILYGAYVRPLLEYANPVVYSGRTKDVILIERVQRAATKMVAGLKSMDHETRLAVLDLFPLEYRRLRGGLILTYALFEQGSANRFSTVDPANTRWGHEVSNPRLGFGISGPIADEIKGERTVVAMSQWSVNCHLISEMSFVGDDQIQEGRLLARAVSGGCNDMLSPSALLNDFGQRRCKGCSSRTLTHRWEKYVALINSPNLTEAFHIHHNKFRDQKTQLTIQLTSEMTSSRQKTVQKISEGYPQAARKVYGTKPHPTAAVPLWKKLPVVDAICDAVKHLPDKVLFTVPSCSSRAQFYSRLYIPPRYAITLAPFCERVHEIYFATLSALEL